MRVFRITEEICRQVFPATLDIDHPGFLRDMERLRVLGDAMAAAKAQGGVVGTAKRVGLTAAAGFTFVRALLRRPRRHPLPADARLAPAW
jgi:magnesium-protoporphyrin IX monomethyl ester (oxidative) cyclase